MTRWVNRRSPLARAMPTAWRAARSLHLRRRLQNAHSVAFGIQKACIQTDARNIHRIPEDLSSRLPHFFQRVSNIRDRDDYRRMLPKRILGFLEETTIDRPGLFRTAL